MRRKAFSLLALAVASSFAARAIAEPASTQTRERRDAESLPALGASVPAAALIAVGAAAVAALASRGGGDSEPSGSGSASAGGSESSAPAPPGPPLRPRAYSGPADFHTAEYNAQQGLEVVKADRLYYNGHYQWSVYAASDPAAGTGIGVKIAVADTGINAREASTGSAISIDVAASYDYVSNQPGSGPDVYGAYGHGTHVAGIIAAPKNGTGMHGLAYNASVINFRIFGDGQIVATDAQRADMIRRSANAGAMIINNSWGTRAPITAYSAEQLRASMPLMIDASRDFLARGGVIVFAAGNDADSEPAIQAGLPHRFKELQPGWVAVVAIDTSGSLASYSNRCGVAKDWCLAAPGDAYSMSKDGGYATLSGTSMAAPHASAALGALKSMFPNLSYLQIRERLLFTANRTGPYADENTYGRGLMDLETASSPVGGVSVPTGTSANGATAPVSGSGIEFQAGTLRALGMQGHVLVVDNYQRAPFWVPAQSFFREATPRFIERQFASLRSVPRSASGMNRPALRFSHSPGLNDVVSADLAGYRLGFSKGTGGETTLGSHLELGWLPHLASPGVDSVALGYAADLAGMRIGLVGTVPSTQATSDQRTLESSSLGSRKALGLVAQQRAQRTTYGLSFAVAEDFERPVGIATSGAFGVEESAAFSSGFFVEHLIGSRTAFNASFETAHHRSQANGALVAPAYSLHSASFGARTMLGSRTTFSAGLKHEWSSREAVRLHLPFTIDENGDIGRVTYTLPYDDLLGRSSLTVRFDHTITKALHFRAGLTHERSAFGASATGVAFMMELAN